MEREERERERERERENPLSYPLSPVSLSGVSLSPLLYQILYKAARHFDPCAAAGVDHSEGWSIAPFYQVTEWERERDSDKKYKLFLTHYHSLTGTNTPH